MKMTRPILTTAALAIAIFMAMMLGQEGHALVCTSSLSYGDTVSCSIDTAGETDEFTFSGTDGERIIVRMVDTSGTSFYPKVSVYRPDETLLCSSLGSTEAEIGSCGLDATGTYTIIAKDNSDNYTGSYNLHLQSTSDPGGATSISYGDTLSGILSDAAETDAYTFSGTDGERVLARMADTSGDVYNDVRVYRPDGTLLCSGIGNSTPAEADASGCLLDATGTHTILTLDAFGTGTGNYGVHLQRTSDPVGDTAISYGDTLSGSVVVAAESDAYTFSGTGGERVLARMAATSGNLYEQVRIYRPDGTLLCSDNGGSTPAEADDNGCLLDATGTHTILTLDAFGHRTGNYNLHLQRTSDPANPTSISYGDTLSGSVVVAAESDAYTFSGTGGERVLARMAATSGNLYEQVRIYRPDGTLLCSDNGGSTPAEADDDGCLLDVTGVHTILALDAFGPRTGNYNLHLQRTSDPVGDTSIDYYDTLSASLSAAAELDAYTFAGASGDRVWVSMADISRIYNKVRIYRPDGTLLCSDIGSSEAEIEDCLLNQNGQHTILAGDAFGSRTGNYTLALSLGVFASVPFDPPSLSSMPGYPTGWSRDPVNTATGDFVHSHTDIQIPGRGMPLQFTRQYHSGSDTERALGHGWTHSYDMYLEFETAAITVFYPYGHASTFVLSGGVYVPRPGVFDTLVDNGDGTYTLTTASDVEYDFSSAGALTSVTDRNNNTTSLSYTGSRLTSVTDPGGRTLTFDYDGSDRIIKVTDPLPSPDTRTIEFTYDGNGDLTEVEDVKGGTTTYAYSDHQMTSLTDSNDNIAVQNCYDGSDRVYKQFNQPPSIQDCTSPDPGVDITLIDYDTPATGQTTETDPRGNEVIYTFDEFYRTEKVQDDLGNTIDYEFDSDNNPSCVTDQLGNKSAFSYDSAGNVTQIIDALNTDASCQLKPGGVSSTFTYTANNDVDLETDRLGRDTDYIYDTSGNLTRVVREDVGAVIKALTCFERDGDGLMTALVESTDLVLPAGPTDPCTGNKTEFEYDTYGNQTAVINPRFSGQPTPPKTTFGPDLGGRVLTITNELSHTTTYTYDDQNNVLTVADNLANTTSSTYDAKGNLVTVTDASRQPVSAPESGAQCGSAGTGDGVDDDSDTVVDDGCPSAIHTYDDADRLVEVIDALGQSTTYGYDAAGNRTSVTNANRQPVGPAETGAECGTAGTGDGVDDDADTVADDGCPSVISAFDALNRLQSTTDALARLTSYGYDAASNLSQRTDARRQAVGPAETGTDCGSAGAGNGVDEDADTVPDDGCPTAVYTYDDLGRLTRIDYSDEAVDYTYDDVGSRLTMVDDTGTTTYAYDALDRPTSVTFPGPDTVSHQYDNVGVRTKITYPDSKDVDYTYDEAGNLETVTDWLSKQTSYTYDNAGNLTKTTLPNGVWTDHTYDTADRLTGVANEKVGSTISDFDYTLDATGNRTQMVDLDGTHSYQYDPLYRLTEVTYPTPQTDTYTYDPVGNRLTKDTDDYTYDAADQLTDLEGVSYGYDANGNQTSRGSDTFTYDHENRLTQSVIGGVTSSSVYNGDGLRMSHTVSSTTTDYTWDVAAGLPVVLQDGDNTYVYGLDLISATDGSGVQTYHLYDGLGSTTGLTDGSGNVTAGYGYYVFGALRLLQSGTGDTDFRFTGQQLDSDEGLYYLRARYYDPEIGRFLGRDPFLGLLSQPSTLNAYVYALNNPTIFVDPQGLFGFKDLKKIGNKVAKPVTNTVHAVGEAFGPPYNTTKLLQIADVIPLTPICAWGGRVVGGAIGTAVAGPAGGVGGSIAGAAIGTVGCAWVEKKIGQAAAAATYLQIANSNCSAGTKATATALNSVNLNVDITGKTKISGGLGLSKFVGEAAMYVASSQLLNCGSSPGPGTALAAGMSPKE